MDINYYKSKEPYFGFWTIKRELGEGAFGKVFEITREDFGKTYKSALKAITVPSNQSEIKSIMSDGMDYNSASQYYRGFVEELVGEFAIMAELKGNSNIVSYEDHVVVEHQGEIGWDIFIRMELLTPLHEYSMQNNLSVNDVLRLGVDMCKALEYCQEKNIIHRDIKPENIFVADNGDFKLGDFGIARTVEKTSSGLSRKGTYNYMAPEVYKGEAYGASVDIYSLGIVLYRMLNNGRTPFLPLYPEVIKYSDKELAMEKRMSGVEIPPITGVSPEINNVILKACAYNPADRYSSAAQMKIELEKLMGMTKVSANETAPLPATVLMQENTPVQAVNSGRGLAETQKRGKLGVVIAIGVAIAALAILLVILLGNKTKLDEKPVSSKDTGTKLETEQTENAENDKAVKEENDKAVKEENEQLFGTFSINTADLDMNSWWDTDYYSDYFYDVFCAMEEKGDMTLKNLEYMDTENILVTEISCLPVAVRFGPNGSNIWGEKYISKEANEADGVDGAKMFDALLMAIDKNAYDDNLDTMRAEYANEYSRGMDVISLWWIDEVGNVYKTMGYYKAEGNTVKFCSFGTRKPEGISKLTGDFEFEIVGELGGDDVSLRLKYEDSMLEYTGIELK